MIRCTRCVLPETVSGITFDRQGVCSFCSNYVPEKYLGREALDEIVADAQNKSDSYDCVVPLSGGRDSSYVLYLARKLWNLRVLAVNYDNEFRTDPALVNMKAACESLDVDFVTIRSEKDNASKAVISGLRSSVARKLFRICQACTYGMMSAVYRAAEQYNIPLILWGDSQPEEVGPLSGKASRTLTLRKSRPLFFLNPNYYRSKYTLLSQRLEFPVRGNSCLRKLPVLTNKGIREVSIYNYLQWDRREIKRTVTAELGWRKPADSGSTWRTDCKLSLMVDHCFCKMHGCSKSCFGYCKMINGGHMTRQEALQQEEDRVAILQDGAQVRALLEKEIGLGVSEAGRIVEMCS